MAKPTVKDHFAGKDVVVREIYDRLLKNLRQFGPIGEEPKKTSIHLVNVTALAGVATRRNSLVLTVKSDEPLKSRRIHKSEQASARRFHHQVKLTSPDQVDSELVRWLKRAFLISG